MDPTDLVDRVRSENNTELSRLGSSKSLYADTEGEMESEAVLTALADTTHHAAEVFEGWGEPFADAADRERDHYGDIAGELAAHEPGDRPALVESFRGLETEVDRLGAAVGYTLVAEGKASQATGFFTGQADPGTASRFREISDGYETLRGELLDALEPHEDLEGAAAAATAVVGAAYEEYVDRLESMGINPKPVC
ncbi:MAG: rubrerythrin family protein [Haloarculaceae archaeon]